jgi:hypothetical protein
MDDGHEQGSVDEGHEQGSDPEWQRPCVQTTAFDNLVAPDESLDDDGDCGSVQRSLVAAAALQARTLSKVSNSDVLE